MDEQLLRVKMLGSFFLSVGTQTFDLRRNRDSKMIFLLQYLLQNFGRAIPKEKLIDTIYGDEEIANPVKALQVLLTRLRKLLTTAGLPKNEYIYYSGGMYGWNTDIPCIIDTIEFEKTVQEANSPGQTAERRIELFSRTIGLYDGDFLPNLSGNDWATVIFAQYSNIYDQCFEKVWDLLREKGDYQSMLRLCTKGIAVHPGEERLRIIHISCLIKEGLRKEALEAYRHTTEMLLREWNTEPSDELLALYKDLSEQLGDQRPPLKEIRAKIKEDITDNGAYYCTLMGFIDSYHLVSRTMERSGQSVFLHLCSLTDSKGGKPKAGERLNHAAGCLSEAIKNSLRRGDMYTRYSVTQFLILLVGTNIENCSEISERIDANYRSLYKGRGIRIQYSVLSAAEIKSDGEMLKFAGDRSPWES